MQDQNRSLDLLERRAKGFDELRRQVSNEPDRIGEKDFLLDRYAQTPGRWIERFKHTASGSHGAFGEYVEKTRLARIRVTNERHDRETFTHTSLASLAPFLPNVLDRPLEPGDAVTRAPSIDLELRFAGSAASNASRQTR